MAVVSINYDQVKKNKVQYNHIELSNDMIILFNTGDFLQDWYNLKKYCAENSVYPLAHTSSVDHFFFDGAKYDSAYLVFEDDDTFDLKYGSEYYDEGIEIFVEKGTRPTWIEHHNKYKDKMSYEIKTKNL